MPLFQLRRRRAVREGAGPPSLTVKFDPEARVKLVFAMADHLPRRVSDDHDLGQITFEMVDTNQGSILVRDWGRISFGPGGLRDYIRNNATDEEVADYIESWFPALEAIVGDFVAQDRFYPGRTTESVMSPLADLFRTRVNEILDDHEVAYQLVGSEIVPRDSMAMHGTIVGPVMALTTGRRELGGVEKAYQDALREMKPGGDPSDAITDAGTALQEMLKAVGARGNALGDLAKDAHSKGLFGPHDSKLAEG